jgi:excisionase family DNA binding protein
MGCFLSEVIMVTTGALKHRAYIHGMQGGDVELLPISEFAKRLGISVWTARGWAYRGLISSVKLGKLLQIPASEVGRLVAENFRPALSDDSAA